MKKSITQSKALKATLVGAVAFTPVLAVTPTADAATNYASVDNLISELNVAFDKLTVTEQTALRSAHGKISNRLTSLTPENWTTYLNQLLETSVQGQQRTDANLVVGELVELLASSTTGYEMEQSFNEFDAAVTPEQLNSAFGTTGVTKQQFVNFLVEVETRIFNRLNAEQEYGTYFEVFEDVLYDILANNTEYNTIVVGIARTVKEDQVKEVLKDIVSDAGVNDAEKAAFVALAKAYTPTPVTNPGPGTPVTPPVVEDGELTVDAGTVTSNPQAVIAAINAATTIEELVITLPAGVEEISIPVTILLALEAKNEDAVIVVETTSGSFNVPVSDINLAAAAAQLGVTQSELSLKVTVDQVTNPLTGRAGITVLSPAVDFEVSLTDATGREYTINRFSKPVTRALVANGTLNATTTVAVVVQPNGSYSAVPTFVENGNEALFYRNTTSVYTLIENFQTFKDVDGGKSWAEDYVEKLASRMIVKGVNDTEFKPSAFITRGEFAALLSRGLGITAADMNKKVFKDVTTDQAANKNGEVYAAVEAGLIQGYEDGTFRPYDRITRDQAAIMISRAIAYLGDDKVTFEKSKNSTDFNDYAAIGATARPHVERVYEAGYIEGFLDDTFRPGAETNRAQMAKILYNFLQSVKHIN